MIKEKMNKAKKVNRDLYIGGEITSELTSEIIAHLNELNKEDLAIYEQNLMLNEENQIPYEPITITINSPGGSVTEGCAIINALESCISPIHTHGVGMVASMAVFIYSCGEVRTAGDLVSFGIHGSSAWGGGYIKETLEMMNYCKTLENKLNKRLMEVTNITQEDLDSCETCTIYYDYDKALEKGLINTDIYDEELLNKIITKIEGIKEKEEDETLL